MGWADTGVPPHRVLPPVGPPCTGNMRGLGQEEEPEGGPGQVQVKQDTRQERAEWEQKYQGQTSFKLCNMPGNEHCSPELRG